MPIRKPRAVLTGAETLLGKEIREVIEAKRLPIDVHLIATADDGSAIVTRQEDDLAVMGLLKADEIAQAQILVLAGSPETSRKAYAMALDLKSTARVIDASGGLEDDPGARLRAPGTKRPLQPGIQSIAHPAAIALSSFLIRLQHAAPIRRSVIVVFEPASERGQGGLNELQQQTVGLLSFQKLRKEVFGAQLSFNVLPRYGEEAPRSLEAVELTIDRHLATLLSYEGGVPMPSLRVVQAPVFHGYSFSVWVEFVDRFDPETIATGLLGDGIEVRSKDEEAPSNAEAAGHSGISVGAIQPDRNFSRAAWFWVVADNLRVSAEAAVEVVREALE